MLNWNCRFEILLPSRYKILFVGLLAVSRGKHQLETTHLHKLFNNLQMKFFSIIHCSLLSLWQILTMVVWKQQMHCMLEIWDVCSVARPTCHPNSFLSTFILWSQQSLSGMKYTTHISSSLPTPPLCTPSLLAMHLLFFLLEIFTNNSHDCVLQSCRI